MAGSDLRRVQRAGAQVMAYKHAQELSPANPMDPVVREDSASRAAGHVPSAELVDDKIGKIHPLACIVSFSYCKAPAGQQDPWMIS